jgi:hypothetical protein
MLPRLVGKDRSQAILELVKLNRHFERFTLCCANFSLRRPHGLSWYVHVDSLSTETQPGALGMGGGPAGSAGRRPAGVAPGAVAGSGEGLGQGHLGPPCRMGSRVGVLRVGETVLMAYAREAPCGHELPPDRSLGARPSVRPGCGHGRCSLTPPFSACRTTVPCRSRLLRPSTGAHRGLTT